MRSADVLVDLARPGRLHDLHDELLLLRSAAETTPLALLRRLGTRLRGIDLEAEDMPIRVLVVLRLLAAGAVEAAWAVLIDNASGVVEETFGRSTSSGARRTARRLPLTTRIEPPRIFAWLPGLRDPRYGAPESAYDISDLVTLRVRLEEMWWDRQGLVLAGTAFLRYIAAGPHDGVEIVCTDAEGGEIVVRGERLRRPDHVRGVGGDLTRLAWSGWAARLPLPEFPGPGTWHLALRLGESGITRTGDLGAAVGDAVVTPSNGPRGAQARLAGGRLEVLVAPSSPARLRATARRVLHLIARSAPER